MTQLYRSEIEEKIPHRYENLLLDSVTSIESGSVLSGEFSLQLSVGDDLGRDLFLKQKTHTMKTLITPVIMEFLALGSIVSCGGVPHDYFLFYTGIKEFIFSRENNLIFPCFIIGFVISQQLYFFYLVSIHSRKLSTILGLERL